ncbi:hypothetical protein ES703_102031 [subsurface metagenome]
MAPPMPWPPLPYTPLTAAVPGVRSSSFCGILLQTDDDSIGDSKVRKVTRLPDFLFYSALIYRRCRRIRCRLLGCRLLCRRCRRLCC